MNKKALTLLEIIVAVTILAITLAGLVNLFISGKRWILHSRSRMAGGELGKYFLDPLQMDVKQDEWSNRCLGSGGTLNCPLTQNLDNIQYSPTYNISNVEGTGNLIHRVTVDIAWDEITAQ